MRAKKSSKINILLFCVLARQANFILSSNSPKGLIRIAFGETKGFERKPVNNPEGVEWLFINKQNEVIIDYIKNQKEHHSKENFLDKYPHLLKENGIEFDEKYLL